MNTHLPKDVRAPEVIQRRAPILTLLTLLLAVALLFMVIPAAHAASISVTFSDYGLTGQRVIVYNTTTCIGEYNSTDTIELPDDSNYVIVLKPAITTNYLADPMKLPELLMAYAPTAITYGIIIGLIGGFLWLIFGRR